MAPIHRTERAGAVLAQLKQEILLGRRGSGEHLAEERVAADLGTSRGPVREALRRLVRDGLAVTLPNGRTVVTGLDADQVADLYRLRLQLEQMAAELAVLRATGAELAGLADLLASLAAAGLEGADGTALDLELHRHLVRCSHSPPLIQMWEGLSDTVAALVAVTSLEGFDRAGAMEQHREAVGALLRRDAAAASHWLAVHLLKARDCLMDHLRTTTRT